jgi:hypothetical protein
MEFGGPLFVIAIVAISTIGWVMTTAIRARHGYPLEGGCSKAAHPRNADGEKATQAIVAENEQLKATVGRLEERLKVLERIATDPSRQLADEIEQLR